MIEEEEYEDLDSELPYTLAGCMHTLSKDLMETSNKIKYYGDISDFGNEIGYAVGNIIKNMTESQISDFIFGIKHGISLTNGTH